MKIYLVRHGETDWNRATKLQGQVDIDINENGVAQAEKAAKRLEQIPFERAFCSVSDSGTSKENLPAQCHGEILHGLLQPQRNHLISRIHKKTSGDKTHHRTHQTDNHG